MVQETKVVIIGAGPAGLTAAYELDKANISSVVLEKDNIVGGISRTVNYKGYRFDIGGHRFFTKVKVVEKLWHEVLGNDFLHRPRISRIYYKNHFFHYPLRPLNALFGLGIWNSLLVLLSYLKIKISPKKPENTFEDWVSNRFGKRLFDIFFKTYTEKVWGIPCQEITAEWAAQRIKKLSLLSAITNAFYKKSAPKKQNTITTLIDAFEYPKLGPGMMWERVSELVEKKNQVCLGAEVTKVFWTNTEVKAVEIKINGQKKLTKGSHFISSMPIRELIQKFEPAAPKKIVDAAEALSYRDFITVAIIINKPDIFPDNWIYIHDSQVKVGRIQNFKNWSPHMVPDQNKTCLGLEYFCFEGDGLWTSTNEELIELAKKELISLGFIQSSDIEDGKVVRVPKAYPIYDSTYKKSLEIIRQFLHPLKNLQLIGRNGMHKYNNQDHSMLTAMMAVQNILGENYDLWQVNVEQEYHEEMLAKDKAKNKTFSLLNMTQPKVPQTSLSSKI